MLGNNPKKLVKGTGKLRNQRTSGDHPDNRIIKIGQNTVKNPRDLRRLTNTQTSGMHFDQPSSQLRE